MTARDAPRETRRPAHGLHNPLPTRERAAPPRPERRAARGARERAAAPRAAPRASPARAAGGPPRGRRPLECRRGEESARVGSGRKKKNRLTN